MTNRPVVRIGIDRSKVGPAQAGASARDVARLVDIDAAAYAKQVTAAGPLAFVEAIVYRQDEVPRGVLSGVRRIKGGAVIAGELPLAPTKGFAAPILGSVGEVTAEMIEENPDVYEIGDVAGLSGLQARYDEQLRGTPGQAVNAVGSDGKTRELFRYDAVDGQPLQLTMDERFQIAAEQALANVGPAAALVAIRPSTGEILAAANGPGTGGLNIATFGQYAPGSTFKSVSSLALLRAGDTPDTVVPCTTSVVVDGKRFENYDDYPASGLGNIPLRTAVANSCNTAFISQRGKLGQESVVDAAASLGMGIDHDLGFPAYFGNVVPPAGETEKAADLIGQGKILASPMVMATVIASIQSGSARGALARDDGDVAGARGRRRPDSRRGRRPAGDAPRGGHRRQRLVPARRPRPAGDRQDRHRRVREGRPAAHPRLDDRRPGRPRRRRLRRRGFVRLGYRRPAPGAVPPGRLSLSSVRVSCRL